MRCRTRVLRDGLNVLGSCSRTAMTKTRRVERNQRFGTIALILFHTLAVTQSDTEYQGNLQLVFLE